MAACAYTALDAWAVPLTRGCSNDLFDFGDAPAKHQFCSEERWDVGADESLDHNEYQGFQIAADFESWDTNTTEETAHGDSLILDDSCASSYETDYGRSPSPAEATWTTYQEKTYQPAHKPARCVTVTEEHNDVAPDHLAASYDQQAFPVRNIHDRYHAIAAAPHMVPMIYHRPMDAPGSSKASLMPIKVKSEPRIGFKRMCPDDYDDEALYSFSRLSRPKSARISSKRLDQIHMEAAATSAAASTVALPATPVPKVVPLEITSQVLCCTPASLVPRPSGQFPCKTTILQCCKFTSKQTQQSCKGQLRIVTHKRGHLAVSCSARHQWVWCPLCCNCNGKGASSEKRQRGCTVATHWYERDAFDTGARNHMNVHKAMNK